MFNRSKVGSRPSRTVPHDSPQLEVSGSGANETGGLVILRTDINVLIPPRDVTKEGLVSIEQGSDGKKSVSSSLVEDRKGLHTQTDRQLC